MDNYECSWTTERLATLRHPLNSLDDKICVPPDIGRYEFAEISLSP